MKKILSLLLALCFLLGLAPALAGTAAAAGERTVSPWAAEEIARAEGYGLLDVGDLRADYAQWDSEKVTDWTQPITRAMFLRFALSYAAVMNHSDRGCFQNAVNVLLAERTEDGHFFKNPFIDDTSPEAAAAYALGITEGRGGGIFDPNSLITRQEAAAMLCRAYMACGGEALPAGEAAPFTDEASIALWAKEAVHTLRSWDVLRGMEDGSFDPQGNFTIQQCAVCFLRLSEEMPVSFLKGTAEHLFTQEQLISTFRPEEIRRWDGPLAVFLSRSQGAVLGSTAYFLIYADGGIRYMEPGVPKESHAWPIEDVAFSEDGKTLTYNVTLEEDQYSIYAETADVLIAKAGYYTVTIDVLSGSQTVDHVPLEPREGRWDDVPADAWYLPAAEYCADWGLIADTEKHRFDPAGEITVAQMVETAAHVHSYLTTGDWYLPLRPADWGNAVFRLEDGRVIDGFRAWEVKQWRYWKGVMSKEAYHYSIRSIKDELLGLFPALAEQGQLWMDATLDMGDKEVPGRLEATLAGDFEEGGPALLFYPAETSGYKDWGMREPGAPTQLFLCAQPGNEGSCRGLYYMAEKGIYFETGPYRTAYAWELAHLLDSLRQFGGLPEDTFRPIYDVNLPEGTSYGTWLEPLYRAGILRLDDPDWAFDPEAPVSRAQWAVILYRLLEPSAR
ncbi:MAG: S-layer homology domain-containing protein [Oscillospiraceae bacterium]|nr:S-layer homology domain-containing protein [Oscillospiraceae bacterium]